MSEKAEKEAEERRESRSISKQREGTLLCVGRERESQGLSQGLKEGERREREQTKKEGKRREVFGGKEVFVFEKRRGQISDHILLEVK